ncbi:hypothetical protein Anas_01797 [Armadillidium nasatum]|uniref:C2H2-type domain-containing protein n=1 Tax=Armadillidium nasatum TaxID=96803 RepID=A0A5N5TIN0_9CRUS|nr:hypothetical protein Anas_01797 [Armadillidium nasatum]
MLLRTDDDDESDAHVRSQCPHCPKMLKTTSLRKHIEDMHTVHLTTYVCQVCHKHYRTPNSLQNHYSRYHRRYSSAHSENRESQMRYSNSHATLGTNSSQTGFDVLETYDSLEGRRNFEANETSNFFLKFGK